MVSEMHGRLAGPDLRVGHGDDRATNRERPDLMRKGLDSHGSGVQSCVGLYQGGSGNMRWDEPRLEEVPCQTGPADFLAALQILGSKSLMSTP